MAAGRFESSVWQPDLTTTEWKRSFIFTSKISVNGNKIRPFSKVYIREREEYLLDYLGERIVFVDFMTPAEYTMAILKGNV